MRSASRTVHDLAVAPVDGGSPRIVATAVDVPRADPFLTGHVWHPTRDHLFWVTEGQLWTANFVVDADCTSVRLAGELGSFTTSPLLVTRDGTAVVGGLAVGPNDAAARPNRLAIIPLDGLPAKVVRLPPDVQYEEVVTQRPGRAWQPDPSRITIRASLDDGGETALLQIDTATGLTDKVWSGLGKIIPVGSGPDHRGLVMAYQDFNTPADFYLYDERGGRKHRLSTTASRLSFMHGATVTTLKTSVPQPCGEEATATTAVLLPKGAPDGGHLPAVTFLYPGGSVTHFAAEFAGGSPSGIPLLPFLDRGYAVLLAETPIGPMGQPGNPLDELCAVTVPQVDHAASLGYVDPDRIALVGHSYGGYGAAGIITRTGRFRAAVSIAGMYDLAGGYSWSDFQDMPSRFWFFEAGQGRMGTHPWAEPKRYFFNSPYYQADQVQTPLLLLHGADDPVCPASDAGKMFNALKRLGRIAELAIYLGEGHDPSTWSHANAVDASRRALAFIDQHLHPRGPTRVHH
jgi:dipeptidyl aminopeptidase/acylaminoacyl peptidase